MAEENDKKKINSVPYTKAGLSSEASEKSGAEAGKAKSDSAERTPKTGKEKSTRRDGDKPLH